MIGLVMIGVIIGKARTGNNKGIKVKSTTIGSMECRMIVGVIMVSTNRGVGVNNPCPKIRMNGETKIRVGEVMTG